MVPYTFIYGDLVVNWGEPERAPHYTSALIDFRFARLFVCAVLMEDVAALATLDQEQYATNECDFPCPVLICPLSLLVVCWTLYHCAVLDKIYISVCD